MPTRLINRSLVDNRVLKVLAQDLKDEADEAVRKPVEHEAEEASHCDRDRLRLPAGSAVLYPPSPSPGAGPRPAGTVQSPPGGPEIRPAGSLRRSDQPGELIPAQDRRVFPGPNALELDRPGTGRQPGAEDSG